MRRTIEFVAERLASNHIKLIRNKLVPEQREQVFKLIRVKYEELTTKDLELFARQSIGTISTEISSIIKNQGTSDAVSALTILISDDTHPAAKDKCSEIAVRQLREKVDQWCKQNITSTFFLNEFQGETDRNIRNGEKERAKALECYQVLENHDPSAPDPSTIIIKLKKDITNWLLEDENTSTNLFNDEEDDELTTLASMEKCILHRKDLTPLGMQGLGSVSVDWILSMIARKPNIVTDELIIALIRIWRLICPVQLINVLSPISLVIINQTHNPELTWTKMELLLRCLLEEKLVPALALEDSCLELLQQTWCDGELDNVGNCLAALYASGEWDGALDWVSWFNQKRNGVIDT